MLYIFVFFLSLYIISASKCMRELVKVLNLCSFELNDIVVSFVVISTHILTSCICVGHV